MASVLDRLSLDFDTTRFANTIVLSEKARNFLNTSPVEVSPWVKEELASGSSINRTDYFQNPVSSPISALTSNVNSLITTCTDDPDTYFTLEGAAESAKNLANSANSFLVELNEFLGHTNRMSGVSEATFDEATDSFKPDYQSAISMGTYLLTLTANTDGVRDSSPVMGMFTSLYISDEISANSWSIGNSTILITTTARDTITSSQLETANTKINNFMGFLHTRRTSDINYYNETESIMKDYQFLNSIESSGSTERNIILDKIGTDKLKSLLNS